MKRKNYSILSLFLAVIIMFGSCITVAAAPNRNDNSEAIILYDDGETILEAYINSDGDKIFSQYLNGVLVQRDTVYADISGIVYEEFFGNATMQVNTDINSDIVYSRVIDASDYVKIESFSMNTQSINSRKLAGTINYRATTSDGNYSYGIKCYYDTSELGNTTYTVNAYVGSLATLVATIASQFLMPAFIAENAILNILASLGISLVSGRIVSPFTDTVSCEKTEYTWTLVDTTFSAHTNTVYGYKYVINDTQSKYSGETYFDGYVPDDFKTQSFAVLIHGEMFTYSSFTVVGWS